MLSLCVSCGVFAHHSVEIKCPVHRSASQCPLVSQAFVSQLAKSSVDLRFIHSMFGAQLKVYSQSVLSPMLGAPGGWRSGSEIQADGRCARCIEIYQDISRYLVSEVAPVLQCQLVTTWHSVRSVGVASSTRLCFHDRDCAFSNPSDLKFR